MFLGPKASFVQTLENRIAVILGRKSFTIKTEAQKINLTRKPLEPSILTYSGYIAYIVTEYLVV